MFALQLRIIVNQPLKGVIVWPNCVWRNVWLDSNSLQLFLFVAENIGENDNEEQQREFPMHNAVLHAQYNYCIWRECVDIYTWVKFIDLFYFSAENIGDSDNEEQQRECTIFL